MNGKAVEVVEVENTDAYGFLVLFDSLPYASQVSPKRLVGVETLTVVKVTALGDFCTRAFTNNQEFLASAVPARKHTYQITMY
ncbi:hypothetical protein FIM08_00315 [SAR202 cluster bacterium AC-647-N09_OGT_505m]|nr:hypothetical protein [SAR202 cluster bacterium AC-647-N09_OGT_505m]